MEGHKKLEQVLQIDPPNELVFKGEYNKIPARETRLI